MRRSGEVHDQVWTRQQTQRPRVPTHQAMEFQGIGWTTYPYIQRSPIMSQACLSAGRTVAEDNPSSICTAFLKRRIPPEELASRLALPSGGVDAGAEERDKGPRSGRQKVEVGSRSSVWASKALRDARLSDSVWSYKDDKES
jgi:hypothetical protein